MIFFEKANTEKYSVIFIAPIFKELYSRVCGLPRQDDEFRDGLWE